MWPYDLYFLWISVMDVTVWSLFKKKKKKRANSSQKVKQCNGSAIYIWTWSINLIFLDLNLISWSSQNLLGCWPGFHSLCVECEYWRCNETLRTDKPRGLCDQCVVGRKGQQHPGCGQQPGRSGRLVAARSWRRLLGRPLALIIKDAMLRSWNIKGVSNPMAVQLAPVQGMNFRRFLTHSQLRKRTLQRSFSCLIGSSGMLTSRSSCATCIVTLGGWHRWPGMHTPYPGKLCSL